MKRKLFSMIAVICLVGMLCVPSSAINDVATPNPAAAEMRMQVVDYAAQFLGVPYVWGGAGPNNFDCSGLMYYVYGNLVRKIPRVAHEQYNALVHVSLDQLQPGDLIFYGNSPTDIEHVVMYVGKVSYNGKDYTDAFIHAPHTGAVVCYRSLSAYGRTPVGAARVILS